MDIVPAHVEGGARRRFQDVARQPAVSSGAPVAEVPGTTVARPRHAPRRWAAARRGDRLRRLLLAPAYGAYTARLRHDVSHSPLPHHVAVILDGNRRWATAAGLHEPGAGHRHGADKLDDLIAWCSELGIAQLTVWALSVENAGRESHELDPLLAVIAAKLDALTEHAGRMRRPMRIGVFGRYRDLPEPVQAAAERAEAATSANPGLRLNIALGYSGRQELVDACRTLVAGLAARGVAADEIPAQITGEAIAANLYTAGAPDPDLIIRTSGEIRLSGFLPWQSVYSEFYFTDVYWPAFRELDFLRALRSFQQRERRFGR
jgi:short-chain Z-isoprenyl diphosphate synthase